jgi:hypothetical protein
MHNLQLKFYKTTVIRHKNRLHTTHATPTHKYKNLSEIKSFDVASVINMTTALCRSENQTGCVCVCMYVCVCVYVFVCVCVCTEHMHTCLYKYIYTHLPTILLPRLVCAFVFLYMKDFNCFHTHIKLVSKDRERARERIKM